MAVLQQEGWPLGLPPVNVRVIGLAASATACNGVGGGPVSVKTLLTASPSNSSTDDSSSDLDSQSKFQSTGSFFHERRTTFGTLIGASSTLDLSKRSTNRRNGRKAETSFKRDYSKSGLWFFSICCRNSSDVDIVENNTTACPPLSLSHFLAVEREAKSIASTRDGYQTRRRMRHRRKQSPGVIGPYYDGVGLMCQATPESNSLFVDGRIAPPRAASPWLVSHGDHRARNSSLLLSWICGPN